MGEDWDRRRLRATFAEVPELYDCARPTYPPEVFDDLVDLADLAAGSRILEIGCGTGQATIPLAERGLDVTCIELGEQLATLARRKLARFDSVRVETGAFETWEPEEAGFDAIVAFTAFHWIDPDARYDKTARLLRDTGSLAVVQAQHVLLDGGDSFWIDVQEDYDAVVPSDDNRPPPPPEDVPDLREEIEASGAYGSVDVRRHVWDVGYTADEYIAVLDTYSGHRSIEPGARGRLYERIHRRVEARPGGRVDKTYLAVLNMTRRR